MKTEAEVFKDLEALCTKPGYAHSLARLSIKVNFEPKRMARDSVYRSYKSGKLLQTELSTLVGLAVKGELNTDPISSEDRNRFTNQTYQLMGELHTVLNKPFKPQVGPFGNTILPQEKYIRKAKVMREPIFYSSEASYSFQYKEFASLRYAGDNEWLQKHKGFCFQEAQKVVEVLWDMQNRKIKIESTRLYVFTFTLDEIIKQSKCTSQTVENVINAFCLKTIPCNQGFNGIGDFNEAIACPIIKISNDEYLLLQLFNLIRALYESPFYWMIKDKDYEAGNKHRGDFAERFCADTLKSIFGQKNVHKNVKFEKGKGEEKGEIDVLVTYSNRAIVLQAKSKKLTLEARKGNDRALKEDFKLAIQKAYYQGFSCAKLLNDQNLKVFVGGKPLDIRRDFREIYIFTVVSEHYPSLTFQAPMFLEYETTDVIPSPFVMDIFFLDVLCEFVKNPLYFLDFIQKRIRYFSRIITPNEFTILSVYLKENLCFPDNQDCILIEDDVCADIDTAMRVRRGGFTGDPNIDGILTKWKNHTFGKLIEHVSRSEQKEVLDVGFFLLSLNEDKARLLGNNIEKIIQTHSNGKRYGISDIFGDGEDFHTSSLSAYNLWKHFDKMEKIVSGFVQTELRSKKIGRNEPCPCGSGKKYKHCHGKTV